MEFLSNEILLVILEYCPKYLKLRLVCKYWKEIIDQWILPEHFTRNNLSLIDLKEIIKKRLRWKVFIQGNIFLRLDDLFRENLINFIHHLDLDNPYSMYRNSLIELPPINNVHSLSLKNCPQLNNADMFQKIHTLNLSHCQNLTDIRTLGKVHTLDLSYCSNLTDVSSLGGVHTLNLSGCDSLTDVSKLANVYDLNLSGCRLISDVSSLCNVHTLNLSKCLNVTDVNSLGAVYDLNLDYSIIYGTVEEKLMVEQSIDQARIIREGPFLKDISCLNHVHTLSLACSYIKDVSFLTGVHTLNLNHCWEVKNISGLSNLQIVLLDLTSIDNLGPLDGVHTVSLVSSKTTKVESLRDIHILNLQNCRLDSLKMLKNIYDLDLSFSFDLPSLSELGKVSHLKMRRCRNFDRCPFSKLSRDLQEELVTLDVGECVTYIEDRHLIGFKRLQKLDLSRCLRITDQGLIYLSKCSTLTELNLSGCLKITDLGVKHFTFLRRLDLSACVQITDQSFRLLSNLYKLKIGLCNITDEGLIYLTGLKSLDLNRCDRVTDRAVRFLGNLKTLILSHCTQITDLSIKNLGNVYNLNLSFCHKITDESVKYLTNLDTLNLTGCSRVTDASLKYLGRLRYLAMGGCQYTLSSINRLVGLKKLNLYDYPSNGPSDDKDLLMCHCYLTRICPLMVTGTPCKISSSEYYYDEERYGESIISLSIPEKYDISDCQYQKIMMGSEIAHLTYLSQLRSYLACQREIKTP